jgi:hypothetical protein
MRDYNYINGLIFNPKDGYLRISNGSLDNPLPLNESTINKAMSILKDNKISKLSFGTPFDDLKDIYFLKSLCFLKGVRIGLEDFDINPLAHCNNLEEIDIPFRYEGAIDFSDFPKLKILAIDWRNTGSSTVFSCKKLQTLSLSKYSGASLTSFSVLQKLEKLILVDSKILSLAGVEQLGHLKELQIIGAKELTSIDHIEGCQMLNEVFIDGCKQVESLHFLMYLKNLKKLNLDNIGELSTIKFLKPLKQLEEFYMGGSTNVLDGDLKVLQELKENGSLKKTIFKNRKHYTHTREQLGYKVPASVASIFKKKK